MKDKLGYIGTKKPKDYTRDKYIVIPTCIRFSEYFKEVGSISPMILESEIDLDYHDINFLPIKVNVFDRETFESNIKYIEDKEHYISFLKKVIEKKENRV